MKIHLDCIPCNLRQVLEAARLATTDEALQARIVAEALAELAQFPRYETSPQLGRAVLALVQKHTGNKDPYRKVKEQAIALAHRHHAAARQFVEEQTDRFRAALEVAAIGNVLDAAVYGDLQNIDLQAILREELTGGSALGYIERLRLEITQADSVVIIGDNAGETVFDGILISEIKTIASPGIKVYFAVRSAPILNDATREDAIASGLGELSTIVETGSTSAGLLLSEAAPAFLALYDQADVVISKGQGNYETLSEGGRRPVYFLLKAKCQAVAGDVGVSLGEYVLLRRDF